MADEFNKNLGYEEDDKHIGMMARGAATAGLITAGLGIPTLFSTVRNNFPRGTFKAIMNKHNAARLDPVSLTMMVSNAYYEQHSSAETFAKVIAEDAHNALSKGKATSEHLEELTGVQQRITGPRAERLEEQLSEEFLDSRYTTAEPSEILDDISKLEGKINNQSKSRTKYSIINAKRSAMWEFLAEAKREEIQYSLDPKSGLLESIFENDQLSSKNINAIDDALKSKSNTRYLKIYRRMLESGSSVIPIGEMNQVLPGHKGNSTITYSLDVDNQMVKNRDKFYSKHSMFKPRKMFNYTGEIKPIEMFSMEFTGSKMTDADKFSKEFLDRMITSIDSGKRDSIRSLVDKYTVQGQSIKYSQGFKKLMNSMVEAQLDINAKPHELSRIGGQASFSVAFNYRRSGSKYFPEIIVAIRGAGTKKVAEYVQPVSLNTSEFLLGSTVRVGGGNEVVFRNQKVEVGSIPTGMISRLEQNTKGMYKEFAQNQGMAAGIVRGINANARDISVLRTSSALEQLRIMSYMRLTSHAKDFGLMDKKQKARSFGMGAFQLDKAAKMRGMNFVAYDIEYYHDHATPTAYGRATGPQLVKKNIDGVKPFQISFRKYDSSGGFINSGSFYIRDTELLGNSREPMEGMLKTALGYSDNQIDYTRARMKKGISLDDAIKKLSNEFSDSVTIDQYGREGLDRLILNRISTGMHPGTRGIGQELIPGDLSVDVKDIAQVFKTSANHKHLEDIFETLVKDSHIDDVNMIIKDITHNVSKMTGRESHRWASHIAKYRKPVTKNDKIQMLVDTFRSASHDAEDDAAATYWSHKLSIKQHRMYAYEGTAINELARFQTDGFTSPEEKMSAVRRFFLAKQFIGEGQAAKELGLHVGGFMPSTTKPEHILAGRMATLGTMGFDQMGMFNSGTRPDNQRFNVLPLMRRDAHGRQRAPVNRAFQNFWRSFSDDRMAEQLKQMSKVPMMNVFYAQPGTFSSDSVIKMHTETYDNLYSHTGQIRKRIQVRGPKNVGMKQQEMIVQTKLTNIVKRAEGVMENTRNKPEKMSDDEWLNDTIKRLIKNDHKEYKDLIARKKLTKSQYRRLKLLAGDYVVTENEPLFAYSDKGFDTKAHKYNHHMNGKIVDMDIIVKNKQVMEANVYFERSLVDSDFLKVQMPQTGGKGTVMPADLSDVNVIADNFHTFKNRNRIPEMVADMKFIGREEFGAYRQLQFNRIHTALVAQGPEGKRKAARLMHKVYSGLRARQLSDGTVTYDAPLNNPETQAKVANNLSLKHIYGYARETHTWDEKTMKGFRLFQDPGRDLDHLSDMAFFNEMADRKQKKWDREYRTTRKTVAGQMDAIQMEEMRIWNVWNNHPFVDLVKTTEDAHAPKNRKRIQEGGKMRPVITERLEQNARLVDFLESKTGQRITHVGLFAPDQVAATASFPDSNKPVVNQVFRAPIFVFDEQMQINNRLKGSTLEKLVHQSTGAKYRYSRETALKLMNSYIGLDNVKGVTVDPSDLNSVVSKLSSILPFSNVEINTSNIRKIYNDEFTNMDSVKNWTGHLRDLEAIRHGRAIKSGNRYTGKSHDFVKQRIERIQTVLSGKGKSYLQHGIDTPGSAILTAEDMADTIFARTKTGAYGNPTDMVAGFKDKELRFGTKKIAPNDLIKIRTPGVKIAGSMEFFNDNLFDALEKSKTHDFIKNAILEAMKVSESKEYLTLPSPQALLEMTGASYYDEGGSVVINANRTMKLYSNVLWTANELTNASGKDVKRYNLLKNKLVGQTQNFITDLLGGNNAGGKDSVMDSHRRMNFYSQRGTAVSQMDVYHQIQGKINNKGGKKTLLSRITNDLSREARKAGKTLTSEQLRRSATKEYTYSLKMMNAFNDPNLHFVSKQQLGTFDVGGINVRDWFKEKSKLIENRTERKDWLKKWRAVMYGDETFAMGMARPPVEHHQHGIMTGEFMAVDENSWILRNTGIKNKKILNTLTTIPMAADFDGDAFSQLMLLYNSVDDMNKVMQVTRETHKQRFNTMNRYTKMRLKGVSSTQAVETLIKMKDYKDYEANVKQIAGIAESFFDDNRLMIEERVNSKGRSSGYTMQALSEAQRQRLDLKLETEFTDVALIDLLKGDHNINEKYSKFMKKIDVLTRAKAKTGEMYSAALRFQHSVQTMRNLMDSSAKTGVDEQFLKTRGLDRKHAITALDALGSAVTKDSAQIKESMNLANLVIQSQIQEGLTGKHLRGEDATIGLIKTVSALSDLRDPGNQKTMSSWYEKRFGTSYDRKMVNVVASLNELQHSNDLFRTKFSGDMSEFTSSGSSSDMAWYEQMLNSLSKREKGSQFDAQRAKTLQNIIHLGGVELKTSAQKASEAWSRSIKQALFSKKGKVGFAGLGVMAALQIFSPNQLTGGLADFGMDIGHRPGGGGERGDLFGHGSLPMNWIHPLSNFGLSDFDTDPYEEKWAKVVKHNPVLNDKMEHINYKKYNDLASPKPGISQYDYGKRYTKKRRYVNNQKSISKYYKTNDVRRADTVGF